MRNGIWLTVACVMVGIAGVDSINCPVGSTLVDSQYCFIASRGRATFFDAYTFCEAYGCRLALPTDAAKQAAIRTFATSNSLTPIDTIWGITDVLSEDTWVGVDTDGTDVTSLINWNTGQPNGGIYANCLQFSDYTSWKADDQNCGNSYKFMCECPTIAS